MTLTYDCIDWYYEDEAIIANMTEEELEAAVLYYLTQRAFYRHEDESSGAAQASGIRGEQEEFG